MKRWRLVEVVRRSKLAPEVTATPAAPKEA